MSHRPLFQPTIKTGGSQPGVASIFVPRGQFDSQAAVLIAHRPLFPAILKGLGGLPIVGQAKTPFGTRAAHHSAELAHRPLFQPLVKRGAHFAILGTFLSFSSKASAYAYRVQHFITRGLGHELFPPSGGSPVGQQLIISRNSQAAALYYRRTVKVFLKGLGKAAPTSRPGTKVSFVGQAIPAAINARERLLHSGSLTLSRYVVAPVIPLKAQPVKLTGGFASLAAANFAHRPLFRVTIATIQEVIGPPGPPIPGLIGGGVAPLLNRDPVQDPRLRRAMEILSSMYNSLVGRGYIRQQPIGVWSLQTGAFQVNRPPGINDDSTVGVIPGSIWINTVTGAAYINITNTPGAATWSLIT
jgi:hypothetical protein